MSRISDFRSLLPISTLALLGALACGEEITDPAMSPQLARNTSQLPAESYLITTYYWADGGWVKHASWPDPTMGEDAQIFIIARNSQPGYPAVTFTIDNVLASGDTDFSDGVVDDFEDGVIGEVWGGADGGPCREMPGGASGCEMEGVFTIRLPDGRDEQRQHTIGLETQLNVIHGEYDVQLDFSANAGFHESPRQAFLSLSIGQWDGHHADIGLFTDRYLSADNDWSGPWTTYRRTDTDHLQGKLRVKRTRVRDAGRVVESVTGSGSFRVFTQTDDWRTFSFTANRHADGTVGGQWERIRRPEGNASEEKSHGVVTCMLIVGNEAWLAGYATSGLYADPPNNYVRWRIRDMGKGAGSAPDQISLQYVAGTPQAAANYCANTGTSLDLFDLEAGNIQIKKK